MTNPEYLSYRKYESETHRILSRVRFPEARSTIEIARDQLSSITNSAVLEIGCGPGVTNMYLSYHISAELMVGVDTDREAISQGHVAARYLGINNLGFIVASATHLPIRSSQFNFVLCQEVIEHVPTPGDVLKESYRVLGSEGKLLITTPTSKIAPLSSDWFEFRMFGHHTMDEFAGHLYRFASQPFVSCMEEVGFRIMEIKFTNQYLGSFFLFVSAMWKRKKLRNMKVKVSEKKQSSGCGVANLVFMIGQTIDFKILGRSNFGSNIVVLASAKAK